MVRLSCYALGQIPELALLSFQDYYLRLVDEEMEHNYLEEGKLFFPTFIHTVPIQMFLFSYALLLIFLVKLVVL